MAAKVTHLPVPQATATPSCLIPAADYCLSLDMTPEFARDHGFPELADVMTSLALDAAAGMSAVAILEAAPPCPISAVS